MILTMLQAEYTDPYANRNQQRVRTSILNGSGYVEELLNGDGGRFYSIVRMHKAIFHK